MTKYKIERIYGSTASDDSYRVLVDRLWPRGISKERAALDEWNKEIVQPTNCVNGLITIQKNSRNFLAVI